MLGFTVSHGINTTVGSIMTLDVGVVTRIQVVPIDDVHLPIRPVPQIQDLRCQIIGKQKILTMMPDKPRALPLQNIHIDPLAMDVVHEDARAILIWPLAT